MKLKFVFVVSICTLVFLAFSAVSFAQNSIPAHTQEFYVNDFANVFTEQEKAELVSRAISLDENHNGIQVVITTIDTLNGEPISDYSNRMYNQYGIGKDDMGVLILLVTQDRDVRITTR